MLPNLTKIKGVHPGDVLRRELTIRNLKATDLSHSIDEHKQTISAILNKRRDINPKLSIKLGEQFKVEQDYFMLLQASYDVKLASDSITQKAPNLEKFRTILFWDTTVGKIDWDKNKRAIIQRVLERGNKIEMEELISFYGEKTIKKVVKTIKNSRFSAFKSNVELYQLS